VIAPRLAALLASIALVACGAASTDGDAALADAGPADAAPLDASAATPSGLWTRSFEAACPDHTVSVWQVLTWRATTPGDARIDLFARAADTEAAAAKAPRVHLAGIANQHGNGAFVPLGAPLGDDRVRPWLRLEGDLFVSSDGQAPTMDDVAPSFDCLPTP
jgi:hypothetical protein